MTLSQRTIAMVLALIEDRISQFDPFIPQDTDDLDMLMRCKEEMSVIAMQSERTSTLHRVGDGGVNLDVI